MLGPPKPRRLDEPIALSLEDLVVVVATSGRPDPDTTQLTNVIAAPGT